MLIYSKHLRQVRTHFMPRGWRLQLRRGVAGYRGGSPHTQSTFNQEKREAFCPSAKTGQDHEHPFEGGNRFISGLSFHQQMTLAF